MRDHITNIRYRGYLKRGKIGEGGEKVGKCRERGDWGTMNVQKLGGAALSMIVLMAMEDREVILALL